MGTMSEMNARVIQNRLKKQVKKPGGELVSVNYRVVLFSVSVADHISQKIMTCSNSAIQQCYNAAIASNI